MKKGFVALISITYILTLSACGNTSHSGTDSSDSVGSTVFNSDEETTSGQTYSGTELSEKEKKADSMTMTEFLGSEDGLAFQKAANKAAVAYLRNDMEKLSQYLADPNYSVSLSEDGKNLISDLDYMILRISNSDITPGNDEIYPVEYEFVVDGTEMIMYLDLGLRQMDGGWKVEYIDLQG